MPGSRKPTASVRDAARQLGINERTLGRAIKNGTASIRTVKIGERFHVVQADIDALVEPRPAIDLEAARRYLRQHLGEDSIEIDDDAVLGAAAAIVAHPRAEP